MRIPDTSLATIKVCGARVMLCAMAMLFYELFPRQGDQDPRCCRQRPTVALRRPRSKNIAVDGVAVAAPPGRGGDPTARGPARPPLVAAVIVASARNHPAGDAATVATGPDALGFSQARVPAAHAAAIGRDRLGWRTFLVRINHW